MTPLELVATRQGAWDSLQGLMGQDEDLLAEGEKYRVVLALKPYSSALAGVVKAETGMLVSALKLQGVEEASGTVQGNQVVLTFRKGIGPLAVLAWVLVAAVIIVMLLVGYSVYRVARAAGVPTWAAAALAAIAAVWVGQQLRRRVKATSLT